MNDFRMFEKHQEQGTWTVLPHLGASCLESKTVLIMVQSDVWALLFLYSQPLNTCHFIAATWHC